MGEQRPLFAGIVALLFLAVVAVIWTWRRRANKKTTTSTAAIANGAPTTSQETAEELPKIAILEPLSTQMGEPIILDGSSFTFGSDPRSAQIVLNDVGVSRLHARIRRQEQSYWLLDEGSMEGVFLNYERLGLAPRELHDGDLVQFGKVSYHFYLR
jgi:pSer/pThr/pTyr-binding forkhead associated (FHA) protein